MSNANTNINPLEQNDYFDCNFYSDLYYQDSVNRLYGENLADVIFWENIAKNNYQKVLELGCGYGRLLFRFVKEGRCVKGIDASPSMLNFGRHKYPELELIYGDMRDFELGEKFDLIYLAYNTFLHLKSYNDLKACLDCVKKHLTSDGKIIITVTHISDKLLTELFLFPQQEKVKAVFKCQNTNEFVVKSLIRSYDHINQILTLNEKYVYVVSKQETIYKTNLKLYFPKELEFVLRSHQLRIEQIFGDYDCNDFTNDSPEQILVCSLDT